MTPHRSRKHGVLKGKATAMDRKSVHPLPEQHPGTPRTSIRTDARLDQATRPKVDELAQHFGRPRAAVWCQIMAWGLSRGPTGPLDQGEAPGPVRHVSCYVASALHAQVEKAATAVGMNIAPWLRQITLADVPASWQEARSEQRSHDFPHL
jgi:hypothetical protein